MSLTIGADGQKVQISYSGVIIDPRDVSVDLSNGICNAKITDVVANQKFNLFTPKFAAINVSSAGNNQIVAAVAGFSIRVLSYVLCPTDNVSVYFKDHTSSLSGTMLLVKGVPVCMSSCEQGMFQTRTSEELNINLSSAVQVGGHLTYIEYKTT